MGDVGELADTAARGEKRDMMFVAHPLANLFPLTEGAEFDALVEDIRAHGQHSPIVIYEGKILDGRNRYRACVAAKMDPAIETYTGDDPLAYVISLNLKRRHLNESQRAMIAAKLATMRQGERTDLKPSANLQKVAQADAAALLHISARTVASATKVRNAGSATLVEAVEHGRIAVSAAAKIARSDPEIQRMVVERVKDGSEREAIKAIVAVTRQRRDDARLAAFNAMVQEKITPDTSRGAAVAMLGNRPLRIAHEPPYYRKNVPGQLAWILEIHPSIDGASYERLRAEADQDKTVAGWRRKHEEITKKAADLEAEAKKLEARARKFERQAADLRNQMQARIHTLVEQQYGPVHLGAEVVTFEASAETDGELAAMPPEQQAKRLVDAYAATENGQSDPMLKRTGLSYHWPMGVAAYF